MRKVSLSNFRSPNPSPFLLTFCSVGMRFFFYQRRATKHLADVRGVEELFEECSEIDDMAELFADEAKVSADLEKMRGGAR